MAGASWPGFVSEGVPVLTPDLTLPAVEWATMATPFGINGIFGPLVLIGIHMTTLQHATAGGAPGACLGA